MIMIILKFSCRFDSFYFLFIYGICPYIPLENNNIKESNFFKFKDYLLNKFKINPKISFWDCYESYNIDFLNIRFDQNEWKQENTITSLSYFIFIFYNQKSIYYKFYIKISIKNILI